MAWTFWPVASTIVTPMQIFCWWGFRLVPIANTVVKYLGESANHLPNKVVGGVSLCNLMRINHSHLTSPWREILSFGAKKHYFQYRWSTNQMMCYHYQDDINPTKFTHRSNINKTNADMVPFIIRNLPQYHWIWFQHQLLERSEQSELHLSCPRSASCMLCEWWSNCVW